MQLPDELFYQIQQGESLTVEFKKSTSEITTDVYDSICAFSNREGGSIFFGVSDKGNILGVDPDAVERMKKNFVTTINNPGKIYPPLYLSLTEYEYEGKIILYTYVPVGTTVCRKAGKIFDRNNESDVDITNNADLVFRLYARKQESYYVNKVYPVFKVSDLRHDLLERARKQTRSGHPWRSMDDEAILRSAKLMLTDRMSGQEGITLAAILLFGPDQLIYSVLPQHKTDALVRVYDTDRYDDRDMIETNLLDSYDRLMEFGRKHLNDIFTLDGIHRVSSRDEILREVIANLLSHRDFSSGYIASMIIERRQLVTKNGNVANGFGSLKLGSFKPVPKNPPIANVFREIGWADELGSGMRNTYKYTRLYSGADPQFIEGDMFQTVIPLKTGAEIKFGPGGSMIQEEAEYTFGQYTEHPWHNGYQFSQLTDEPHNNYITTSYKPQEKDCEVISKTEREILRLVSESPYITIAEIADKIGSADRTVAANIKKLKDKSLLARIGGKKGGYWKIMK
ncbi:MAG: putative DNA binding domain-containing protein [Flexilinea sp.]|nr:putative DNA binding domain-containing protein [Flexilinea sp.]